MARTPTTVRLNDAERDVLRAAARRTGTPYTRLLREAALDRAVNVLHRDVEQVRPSGSREDGGE